MRTIVLCILSCACSLLQAQPYIKSILRLPDTGLKQGFTNTIGEDNDITFNPPGYHMLSDSIVMDTVTGLVWQASDGGEMTWEQAKQYAMNARIGNYSDWRLPTAFEAFTILHFQYVNPAFDTRYFTKTLAEYWWTSDVQWGDSSKIWVINAGGGIGNHPKNETLSAGGKKRFHVKLVRQPNPGKSYANRFENIDALTVFDHAGDVFWLRSPLPDSMTWEAALLVMDSLNARSDYVWHLPNIREMYSIATVFAMNPALSNPPFSGVLPALFWSSTSMINQSNRAWHWDAHSGLTSYSDKTLKLRVWPVSLGKKSNVLVHDAEKHTVNIFPNPVNDVLQIRGAYVGNQFQLFSNDGRMVLYGDVFDSIDMHCLNSGLYYLIFADAPEKQYRIIKL